jgi:hypothetical protein
MRVFDTARPGFVLQISNVDHVTHSRSLGKNQVYTGVGTDIVGSAGQLYYTVQHDQGRSAGG